MPKASACAVDEGRGAVSSPAMILGQPVTLNPFADPDIHWAEVAFEVGEATSLSCAGHHIALPDDLAAAVPKRRSEFLAGRLCAAIALRAAGLPEEVGRLGRAPVWPKGCTGSITHSRNRAIAVVSRSARMLGIDCEALVPEARAQDLREMILTDAEAALRPEGMAFGTYFTLVFSAKEALYKARAPGLTRIPGFLEVTTTAFTADSLHLTLDGIPAQARYVLSGEDCVTMVSA